LAEKALIYVRDNMLLSVCGEPGRWAMVLVLTALFPTKEEVITSIIAMACIYGDRKDCREYRNKWPAESGADKSVVAG
jgi:hypothetical protein